MKPFGVMIREVENGYMVLEGTHTTLESDRRKWVAEDIASLSKLIADLASGIEPKLEPHKPA